MRFAATILLVLTVLIPFACSSDDPVEPSEQREPGALAIIGGNGQNAAVGTPLADPLVVEVTDTRGAPMGGVTVHWSVSGAGALSATTTRTDDAGEASVTWTLGTIAGTDTVTASVTGLQAVTFTATGTPDRPANVEPSEDSLGFTAVGDTARIILGLTDRYGNAIDSASIEWSSSDTLVAQVDSNGLVTSRGRGTASIMALADTARAIIEADVEPVPATLTIEPATYTLALIGDTVRLVATVKDRNGFQVQGADVSWESMNPAVVTVDASGLVEARSPGTANVRAVSASVADTASLIVTGENIAQVVVEPASASFVALGDSEQFTATAYDGDGQVMAGIAFGWESLDPAVATADGTGLATAAGNGSTGVVARAGAAADTAAVTVDQEVAAVVMSPSNDTINAIGDTLQLSPVITDANGHAIADAAISWASLDATVATVDAAGRVVSVDTGTARITAASAGLADTATVLVRQVIAAVVVTPAADTLAAGESLQLSAAASDSNGVAVPGANFAWTSSDAAVAPVDPATGEVEGRLAGAATITAGADGAAGAADITVVPGPVDTAYAHAGDAQTGPAGEPLADSLAVKVTDAFGNAISGATVTFTPRSGSGSVGRTSVSTNSAGLAKTSWTLGPTAGTDSVDVAVTGLAGDPIVFTATATPNGTITGSITFTASIQSLALDSRIESVPGGRTGRALLTPSAGGSSRDAVGRPGRTSAAAMAMRTMPQQPEYVPGSLIVTYRNGPLGAPPAGARAYASMATARAVATRIRARLAAHASTQHFELRGVSPAIQAARIRVEPGRLAAVRAALMKDPAIARVEREGIAYAVGPARSLRPARVAAGNIPDDPLFRPQMWHYNAIDLPAAWNLTTGSREVVVAVVDDGIRFDHPSIAGNLTSDGYDFVRNDPVDICGILIGAGGDGDGYDPDPTTPVKYNTSTCGLGLSHGLHVAGTIGAVGDDGIGVTGVNWSVSIRPVRVLGVTGSGSLYDIAQGILYAAGLPADDGAGGTVQAPSAADIINLSLAGYTNSTDLQNAVQAATNAGSLIVAAAGNDATSLPAYPAAYPEVVSVSAVGPDLQLASYSNFGSTIDIAAPGGDRSDGGDSYGIASTLWDFATNQPTYGFENGTSMAAPHVSGVAALLLARDPSLTTNELRARLLDYATDLGTPGRDNLYGYGLVNARNSLTRTLAPDRDLYARLYDADTGEIIRMLPVEPDGTYAFTELDDGSYFVFAGLDDEGDQKIGVPGRLWGGYGSGTTAPASIVVAGAGSYPASFSVGFPGESEPNDAPVEADRLVVGGYVYGTLPTTSDVDMYRITVPAGQYTFETSGWLGACVYAGEADTVLELYDDNGTLIASNNDIDVARLNYCSRITQTLQAGTYEIRVTYFAGGALYRLQARAGT